MDHSVQHNTMAKRRTQRLSLPRVYDTPVKTLTLQRRCTELRLKSDGEDRIELATNLGTDSIKGLVGRAFGPEYTPVMSARFHHLILWFLLLSLPVQGWAMVTMQHCGSGHQAMVQAVGQEHQHPAADDSHALHQHGHHGMVTDPNDDLGRSANTADGPAVSQCSACASCCLGAALPISSPTVGSAAQRDPPPTSVGTPAFAFFTGGPDRPPRPSLV
jgi:hypothetical protein